MTESVVDGEKLTISESSPYEKSPVKCKNSTVAKSLAVFSFFLIQNGVLDL